MIQRRIRLSGRGTLTEFLYCISRRNVAHMFRPFVLDIKNELQTSWGTSVQVFFISLFVLSF